MSGIVGIVNLDGAPIDRDLLVRMTDSMSLRGPDAQEIWIDGNVGFGHTMLRTAFEAESEQQPLTLDGKVWLTADARIDGRAELIFALEANLGTKLRIEDRSNGSGTRLPNDAELILYAYGAWGEDCVEHLIGDFAFAIWDSRERRLFCARDHFGVKPFYYAHVAGTFIFSSELNCVRIHPKVSDTIRDTAITDFLLFGSTQEPSVTAFVHVSRLLSAHVLVLDHQRFCVSRYWALALNESVHLRRPNEYLEQFNSLFAISIVDRLRANNIGIRMSGGLDSSAVAATARAQLFREGTSVDLRAFTVVYDELLNDDERLYSGRVANKLKIPIHYLVADNYSLFEGWDTLAPNLPEPFDHPLAIVAFHEFKEISSLVRVILTGQGGDPLLRGSRSHYFDLVRAMQFGRLVVDVSRYLRIGQLPPLLLRTNLRRLLNIKTFIPPLPDWLSHQIVDGCNARERWQSITSVSTPVRGRSEAHAELSNPLWSIFFEQTDPAITGVPVDVRHPFFDLRLVNFLLSLPSIPWCSNKEILRRAMRGVLPEEVRCRPKTPLRADPAHILLSRSGAPTDVLRDVPEIDYYVDKERWIQCLRDEKNDPFRSWLNTRPIALAYWLKGQQHAGGN